MGVGGYRCFEHAVAWEFFARIDYYSDAVAPRKAQADRSEEGAKNLKKTCRRLSHYFTTACLLYTYFTIYIFYIVGLLDYWI